MEDIQHRKVRHTRAENEVENFFLSLTRKLDQLFREGKASPYDVDERGNNLLHVCISFLYNNSLTLDHRKCLELFEIILVI